MKTKKAKSWETISEGIVTANEITAITDKRWPITLNVVAVNGPNTACVQIVPVRGPLYNVVNQGSRVNPKPYKYLSCAVRRAVKEYKALLRSKQWKMLVK